MSSSVPKIEEITLDKKGTGLGFNIRGGTDNMHVGKDSGIFVTTVKPNGAASKDGRLQPGDKILEINGNDLREVAHQSAVTHFHNSGDTVKLLVERGAEQRISEELKADGGVTSRFLNSSRRPSWSPWVYLPLGLAILGGAAVIVLYMRKRR
ncbi:synaptojanin-2-binding protein-like isoform X1 [Halichondria panicea]|uniref:synaptojanin-2-binding protein-like isoform X1 n=1 Tax=Halichondria panicea TaxID=6063 RepID=UPI00312B8ECA